MGSIVTYSLKLPKELREKMKEVDLDWAEFIRKTIKAKIEEEERKKASEKLDTIRARAEKVSTNEVVSWLREDRQR
ncbi:MAG: hypothetical protein DRJ41_00955 [Thermoprotei archaeon]|mgnify:CR=1 FL=1|nr:MAG: hypothetical protein DRJ41_00955 [Thermoprotei archaeon]